jgi:hypothetical protein
MTLYSALTWSQGGARPAQPSTFIYLAMTPMGFDSTSADPTKRTEYWADSAGTMTEDDVLFTINGLSSYQASHLRTLSNSYQAALQIPIAYMGTTFAADTESQTVVAHAMLVYAAEGSTPNGFFFVDSNDNRVPMSLSQLQGLGSAIATNYWAVFQKWTALKAQVLAATTVAAVQTVVW